MMRILFLMLFATILPVFGQTADRPQSSQTDEFEVVPDGYVKMSMDGLYAALSNDPAAEGYILNFGTEREIDLRERQIRKALEFRRYDPSRVTIVRAGFWKNARTEFWIVPPGAEIPRATTTAEMFDGFKKLTGEKVRARLDALSVKLRADPNLLGYIVIYDSKNEISMRENQIKRFTGSGKSDLSKVTIKKNESKDGLRTEIWTIPQK